MPFADPVKRAQYVSDWAKRKRSDPVAHEARKKAARESAARMYALKLPGDRAAYVRYRKYGITPDEYDALVWAQDFRCAICRDELEEGKVHTDHCHTTGKVRGLLCYRCNGAIGFLRESIEVLQNAIEYIKRHA